jgi:hypothetical protein
MPNFTNQASPYHSSAHGLLSCTNVCRYLDEDTGNVTLYDIHKYESAGIWVDSLGYACLPIMAIFDDNEREMRLLYSSNYRSNASTVDSETQWIRRPGHNPGISDTLQ